MKSYIICKNDYPFEVHFDETIAQERRETLQEECDAKRQKYESKIYVHIREAEAFTEQLQK